MPKISVIIPVHNTGPHIEDCVRSVINQTMRDIEIICIDDASTDESPKILRTLAAQDPRVIVITLPTNLTANQARKNGVLASSGEMVMFLDGDDIFLPHACETAYAAMHKYDVDVIHFGAKVINRSGVPEARIQWNQNKIAPHLDRVEGDLVVACFQNDQFFFTLWNKIFRGVLARKAFARIRDGRLPRAQDLYAVFVLLYFSRSYRGIQDVLHHYHFGAGITGNRVYELHRFERFCQGSRVANAIRDFLVYENSLDRYKTIVTKIRKNLLNDALGQWIDHLPHEDAAAGYDLLTDNWEPEELVSALAEKSASDPAKFAVKRLALNIRNSKIVVKKQRKENKTIGIFYYRYHSGGVQRVISLLMPLLLSWGFKVVLITEEYEPREEYELPEGVVRKLIPPLESKNYRNRANALANIIRAHELCFINHHATSAQGLLFDILLAKSLGCRVILSRHELAFASFLSGTISPVFQPSVFALADRLTVLTQMDEQYYRFMGVPTLYIPNPVPNLEIQPLREDLASPTILWVGRMDYFQKRCQEPIEIMREVVPMIPNAQLLMVGGGWSSDAENTLRKRINALGLQNNVTLCGYTPHPEKYYAQAACHLMTSSWETYGMVIEESRAFGLPLVMYSMPYLELLSSGKGFIAVEQGDRRAAAEAIVSVLTNPELRARLGKEAQDELIASDNVFLEERWKQILSFAPHANIANEKLRTDLLRLLMENMLHLYGQGVLRKTKEVSEAKKRIAELSRAAGGHNGVAVAKGSGLPSTAVSSKQGDRSLRALEERRARVGALGALDFLIRRERTR